MSRRLGWTTTPVDTANTNRDGTGTIVKLHEVRDPQGEFISKVRVYSLGSNVQTEGVVLASNGEGVSGSGNTFVIAQGTLPATSAGGVDSDDVIDFTIEAWLPQGFELYALVHANQVAGRQFVLFSDPSYQVYKENLVITGS